jgi:hypothetical protein
LTGVEGLERPPHEQSPILKHAELVANDPRAWNVVRHHHERGATLFRLDQQLIDLASRDRVEAGARLVHEQNRRIERHRAGEPGPLLHPSRQVARHFVERLVETDVGELLLRPFANVGVGPVSVAPHGKRHVVPDRHRVEQRGVLKQEAHVLSNVGEIVPGQLRDVAFADEHLPAVGPHQRNDVAKGDALACAAASEQAKGLALRDLERNIVEYLQRAERLGYVIESHRAHPDTAG